MATGGGSMGATCRGTRRRIGGASRLCQVARSCSYVLDGLRSWLRDRCSVLGVNRREGPLSEGSDRGKIENGGCASLARLSSRARWAPRSRSLDPRLLRRSRLLESLALAFDRSSLGIANGRSVRGVNYVKSNLCETVSWQPNENPVSWWCDMKCRVHWLNTGNFKKSLLRSNSKVCQIFTVKWLRHWNPNAAAISQHEKQKKEEETEKKTSKFVNTDWKTTNDRRVHRLPARHMFRVGTRPYKWLEASQRRNGSWLLNKLTPDWL